MFDVSRFEGPTLEPFEMGTQLSMLRMRAVVVIGMLCLFMEWSVPAKALQGHPADIAGQAFFLTKGHNFEMYSLGILS